MPPAQPPAQPPTPAKPPAQPRGRWPKGSIASAAADVLQRAGSPLTLDQLATELAHQNWPLTGNWQTRLRQALRDHVAVCRIDTDTYDHLARRLSGARLLHTLTQAEVRHGLVLAEPDLDDLLLWWLPTPADDSDEVRWIDHRDGIERPAAIAYLTGPQPDLGPHLDIAYNERVYRVLVGLTDWLAMQGARPGDDLCFSPEPPDARRFRLSLHRATATRRAAIRNADAQLAEAALAILQASKTLVLPKVLLRRLAGQLDLRSGPGVHLPVFVLGHDPRFVFDGTFYAPRALGEELSRRRISSPYPRPEDYPADWPHRDPTAELASDMASLLPNAFPGMGTPPEDLIRDRIAGIPPDVIAHAIQQRTTVWDLLQDRSRQLNPAPPTRPTSGMGKLIRGPWPG